MKEIDKLILKWIEFKNQTGTEIVELNNLLDSVREIPGNREEWTGKVAIFNTALDIIQDLEELKKDCEGAM